MRRLPKNLEIWLDLVILLVQRDLRVRYRGSFLGYLWSMVNPLLYMTVLSIVFSKVARFDMPHYPMFILSGILVWNFFAQSMGTSVHSIVNNGALLRKVRVPNSIFPAASVCSMLVNFLLALVPFFLIGAATGVHYSPWVLTLPLLLIPYMAFVFGLSLFVSTLNVSFRDVGHVMEPMLQIAFYATPVFYPEAQVPATYQRLLQLNPMTHFLREFRAILFFGQPPSASTLLVLVGFAVIALALGVFTYGKKRDRFVYEL